MSKANRWRKHKGLKMTRTQNEEFENFDRTMRDLMKVSHDEIKAALDAENSEKETQKKRRVKKPSALDHAASDGG